MPPVESTKTSRLVFENAKKGLNALKKPSGSSGLSGVVKPSSSSVKYLVLVDREMVWVFENLIESSSRLKNILAVAELIGPAGDECLHLRIPASGMVQYCPRRIIQIIHKLFQTLEGG
ncbi:hypothetical protein HZ326_3177 [Fusarium oxysporum f. sp. albedinis]|nr:hypothetical protein HZ326_3177 [Fusarium oxysporum f. sp. albedinis]KAK2474060.1 hypothetical protein H9L39_14020 [Fusarium oxysporum f. sp. albedinis]